MVKVLDQTEETRGAKRLHAQRVRAVALLWAAMLLCGGLLAWLSVLRYVGYNAGMLDLGNMSQAVASVPRGEPLVFTYVNGPMSRLSLHVELFYYLFVPFYMVWSDPRVLLIGQALLFALGALPTYWLARRRTGSTFAASCMALVYLGYPTAQTSVLFDFHGDTLALPMLMFTLDALDNRAWRRYALFLTLALSCKFYVAGPVVLLGILIWHVYGNRRAALFTSVAGLAYGLVAFLIIRPLFTTAQTSEVHRGLHYLSFYFGQFQELATTFLDRLLSALVVFGPVMLLAWRGWRWLLPGLPVAVAALLSTGPGGAYDYRYHHYAIVVPFIVMATIEGVRIRRQKAEGRVRQGRSWRGDTGLTLAIVLIFNLLLVDTPFNPLFWLGLPGQGRDSAVYGITSRDSVKDRFLAQVVPPNAALAASNFLAPHLANRDTLYLLRYPDEQAPKRLPFILPKVDVALADALFDWRVPLDNGFGGGVEYDRSAIELLLRDPSFGLVAERDGLLFFERNALPSRVLVQQIETLPPAPTKAAEQHFGDGLELVTHQIEPTSTATSTLSGERRLRASFTWRTDRPLDRAPLLAVSRLEGVANARIVHLPSYALLQTDQWQPGQLVRETFDVALPFDLPPGHYTWRLGWYDPRSPEAANTDARSRVGDEVSLETIEVH